MAAAATSLGGVFSPPPSTTARLTLPNRPFLFTPRKLLSPPTTTLLSSRILSASQKSLEQDPVEAQIVASEATETPKGEDFFAILMELRLIRDNGNYPTMKFHEHARYLMDKASEHIGSATICGSLKLALLVGLLTCQGSQLAVASTEFSGAAQINSYIGDLGDISTGFASAFLLIFFSELGDKTFFIAALLAARNSGAVVFIGTFGALAAMSIISVILGRSFHYVDGILPFRFGETDFPIDDFAAVCLLVYFGVTTLLEAASGDGFKINEEKKEAEVAISEVSGDGAGIIAAANTVISTFLLVFVAEWGDKSFFSTIALAAASSPLGVIGGALAGHALATLLAVLGGSILGTFLSEKVVAYIGGSLFLVFAAVTLVDIVS